MTCICLLAILSPALADETVVTEPVVTGPELPETATATNDGDGSFDDATSSINISSTFRGVRFTPDVRVQYEYTDDRFIDGERNEDTVLRGRLRLRSEFALARFIRASARIAALCSSDECSPNPTLGSSPTAGRTMEDGDITLDEAYLQFYRLRKFDLALGRLQTKFVARGGVFTKSLDRNDSNGVNVNWTDGFHGTYRADNGWVSHFIIEQNDRENLSGNDDEENIVSSWSRRGYFVGFENLRRTKFFIQRAFDISYLPDALPTTADPEGPREDYYGLVLRSANRWPERNDGIRLRVAAELGYAPKTPPKELIGIEGEGDTDGLAWNVVLSVMDFLPDHSIGVNYAETGAGWLLSPQYGENEKLGEIRYQWRPNQNLAVEVRYRKRKELETLILSDPRQEENDIFLRFTYAGKTRGGNR